MGIGTSGPSPTASTSATTSTGSRPRSPTRGARSTRASWSTAAARRPRATSAGKRLDEDLALRRKGSRSLGGRPPSRSAPSCRRSRTPVHLSSSPDARWSPRPSSLQRRLPRRGHCPHLPGGLRQRQRLLQEDHLPIKAPRDRQAGEGRGAHPGVPLRPAPHRRHRGHDRHRHRHKAARVPPLPA